MKKLCYVATIPAAIHVFLRSHIEAVAKKHHVTIVCDAIDRHLLDNLGARLIFLPIERKPSPWRDALTLLRLFILFRRERFDIVHSIMPKTGMLAMFAAWLACVPIRIHTFTGQVWVGMYGVQRISLKLVDRLIAFFASCVLVDSESQRDFLVQEKVLQLGAAKVIGAGSICGVDPLRFHPESTVSKKIRHDLGIAQDTVIILFVGRLCRDKGALDLATAFTKIAKKHPDVVLLLVGAEEDVSFSRIQEICHAENKRLHYVSFTTTPEHYMMAADIFCLPSYREGFGMTIIEAAACGLPAVATRIYGIIDAVEDGETGLLFTPGDVDALTQNLLKMITENDLRQQMGNAARVRALKLFSSEKITEKMLALYDELLDKR